MGRLKRKTRLLSFSVPAILALSLFLGCGSASASADSSAAQPAASSLTAVPPERASVSGSAAASKQRKTVRRFLFPAASGTQTYGTDDVVIDASHLQEGYFMLKYTGPAEKVKVQVTTPDENVYTYTLQSSDYHSFSLSGGSGSYHVDVLENAFENMYALAFSQDLSVKLRDEFQPFLYPMHYCWYTKDSKVLDYGIRLSESSSDDLDYIARVYHDIITTTTYDDKLAESVSASYVPDPDYTLKNRTGICFDYAALMTALLRSQGIPTKLEVGYSGQAYHAWISVYTTATGWIDNIIQFDGKSWKLMDPTLAANNSASSVGKYIGDGSNYTVKYEY